MRQRRRYLIVGALGLAVLVGGRFAALTGGGNAAALRVTAVSPTITVDPDTGETFAPPADATPAMTAEQAWAKWENHAVATVIKSGMAYSALNQLAGYSWSVCPAGST